MVTEPGRILVKRVVRSTDPAVDSRSDATTTRTCRHSRDELAQTCGGTRAYVTELGTGPP